MTLFRYILRRLAEIIVIFLIIQTVLFFLFHLAPGDPVARMVDPNMAPEEETALIREWGLDQPLGTQYLYFLRNFYSGRFGVSFHYGAPVAEIIGHRLPNTVLLFTTAVVLSALVGVRVGKYVAWQKHSHVDMVVTMAALVCHTLFLPWIAMLILWFFAFKVGWFPVTGMISPELWSNPASGGLMKALDVLHHMALPLLTLFLIHFGSFLLVMRGSMRDVLTEDFIFTARAKGLPERVIRDRHAAPNAALPVVTYVGLSMAFSINGGALTETVFSWPGIGRELVFAVSNNDYPLALGCFLLIAWVVLMANLIIDTLYACLDPRICY
ncbi:MAG: ABC transporter permease [Desulfatitalea sp.]|nr:ABC transporter permease [Desulfatitalea sp.]NNK01089.1 ABC transporter permease [Desulfatitalea sp.]